MLREKFQSGDRVTRVETNQTGTVMEQFIDGSVFIKLDNGRFAEFQASSLEELREEGPTPVPLAPA